MSGRPCAEVHTYCGPERNRNEPNLIAPDGDDDDDDDCGHERHDDLRCFSSSSQLTSNARQDCCRSGVPSRGRATNNNGSAPPTNDSPLSRNGDACRAVRFGAVHVQEHALTIGDHPFCRDALPLTLDWEHGAERTYSVNAYERLRQRGGARGRNNKCRRRDVASRRDWLCTVASSAMSHPSASLKRSERRGNSCSKVDAEQSRAKSAQSPHQLKREEASYYNPVRLNPRPMQFDGSLAVHIPDDFDGDDAVLRPLSEEPVWHEICSFGNPCEEPNSPPSPTSIMDHSAQFSSYIMAVQILEE